MTLVYKAYVFIALAPLLHVAGAVISSRTANWRLSRGLSGAALVAMCLGSLLMLLAPVDWARDVHGLAAPFSLLLGVMIALLGMVITRFSQNYLAGEPGNRRYLQMLHAALAAILVTVLTDNAGVMLVGWACISFALHELLLFYRQRPAAVRAARKKFLLARAAELSLFGAVLILVAKHDSWSISAWMTAYPAPLSGSELAAAVLIALAALIKCAQMPSHGWLIQVVEAPTPISALLHAGIINLGGYLLILFGPLLASALQAQLLVLIVAGFTVLAASREMLRQPAIKVRLAWSTNAQMGLMLIEAALGLYELALLHLYSHSFYKAYLFLRSGSAVEQFVLRQQAGPRRGTVRERWTGAAAGFVMVGALAWISGSTEQFASWTLVGVFAAIVLGQTAFAEWHRIAGFVALALGLFTVQKLALHGLVPTPAAAVPAVPSLAVALVFLSLWVHWFHRQPADAEDPSFALTSLRRLARRGDDALSYLTRTVWKEPHTTLEPAAPGYGQTAQAE